MKWQFKNIFRFVMLSRNVQKLQFFQMSSICGLFPTLKYSIQINQNCQSSYHLRKQLRSQKHLPVTKTSSIISQLNDFSSKNGSPNSFPWEINSCSAGKRRRQSREWTWLFPVRALTRGREQSAWFGALLTSPERGTTPILRRFYSSQCGGFDGRVELSAHQVPWFG